MSGGLGGHFPAKRNIHIRFKLSAVEGNLRIKRELMKAKIYYGKTKKSNRF